jgi:hypothetical protein
MNIGCNYKGGALHCQWPLRGIYSGSCDTFTLLLFEAKYMDFIQTVNVIIGVVSIIIGILLLVLSGWFLVPGLRSKDRVSIVIAIIIALLAVAALVGAYNVFQHGIIQASPYMPQRQ